MLLPFLDLACPTGAGRPAPRPRDLHDRTVAHS